MNKPPSSTAEPATTPASGAGATATEDMLQSWLADADSRIELLSQHLRAVLEVAHTWQPDYATVMDRKTLRLAAETCDYEAARTALATAPQAGPAAAPVPEGWQPSPDDVAYPRDLFGALIDGNSPYAFYLFQWVPYQTDARRWRLKMKHDVKTFDGREAFGIWPNGSSCGPFKDTEVELIRISKQQWGDEWKDPRPTPPAAASTQGEKP